MTERKLTPAKQPAADAPATVPTALPEDKLAAVQGGATPAVPFHRVINNTIYGGTEPNKLKVE